MKAVLLSIFVLINILATIFFTRKKNIAENGFAVVELFTSEGCSSCPPADDAVAKIDKQYGDQVYVLGYHVDYWDHLGWKDVYSRAAFTERQKKYANHFKLNGIYTPQVIVNGQSEFVGSDKSRLQSEVKKALNENTKGVLELTAKQDGMNKIVIHYKVQNLPQEVLNFAIIELKEQSKVTAGENAGRQLYHVNVVRDFTSVSDSQDQGNVSLDIPAGLSAKDCQVIGFAQNRDNWVINAASKVNIKPESH